MSLIREKSYSAAPFIVYRSAKYTGVRERALESLVTYARFYLVSPIRNRFRGISRLLINSFTFLFIIPTLPIFLLSFIALFLIRKLRVFLVTKYFPTFHICDDLSHSYSPFEETKTGGLLTWIVRVKGDVDPSVLRSNLQSRIKSGKLEILSKRLGTRLGLKGWEQDPTVPFQIDKHVIQAPIKFYDSLLTDETRDVHGLGGKSDKSILEKYVTSRASVELDEKLPPWEVTLVSLPLSFRSINQNTRTCVILRFHKLLLQRPQVINMLVTSLDQSGRMEVTDGARWISDIIVQSESNKTEEIGCRARDKQILSSPPQDFKTLVINEYKSTMSDLLMWYRLRKKQYEFHTKAYFAKCVWLEIVKGGKLIKENLKSLWQDLVHLSLQCFKVIRGLSFIPLVLVECFLRGGSPHGFRRSVRTTTRHISWSKPISSDLLKQIQNKAGDASEVSVFLLACSLALKDYYYENCISNPEKIGVIVSSNSFSLKKPWSGNKLLELPTNFSDISSEISKMERDVKLFGDWKELGLWYLERWSTHVLPSPLTSLVFTKFFNRYPVTFNYIDTQSPFPHMTLWGHTIDEFTSWRAPHSDFCVSISVVKYAGSVRLSVISPMKSVDSLITQRFSQYLNRIAESVGVERSKIPYSRKTSPISTANSSPHQKRSSSNFFRTGGEDFGADQGFTKTCNSSNCLRDRFN